MAAAHYYRILGLRTGADFEAVKLAYRNLARLYHPDVNPGDHLAKEKFVQITQAYQAIVDALPAGVSKVSPRPTTPPEATAIANPAPPPASSREVPSRSASPQSPNTGTSQTTQPPAPPPVQPSPGGSETDQDLKQNSFRQLQELFRSQRYPRAVALVEGLAHRFPDDPEIRQWHAITYYRWGQMSISDGNFTKASACLKKAARLDPLNRSLQQSLQQEWQRLANKSQRPVVGGHR
jgi:curved DNA-binding protein CbpA